MGAEIIVIDDASTDSSLDVIRHCQRYFEFKFLRNTENIGVSSSCSLAINRSTKRYLSFLAADDYFHPEALTRMSEMMDKNPDCRLFLWNSEQKYELDKPLKDKAIYSKTHFAFFDRLNSAQFFAEKNAGIPLVGTGIYDRASFLDVGGFDSKYLSYSDYFLCLELIFRHGFYLHSAPISYFRQTKNNLKDKNNLKSIQRIALSHLFSKLKNDHDSNFKNFLIQSGALLVFEEILADKKFMDSQEIKPFCTSKFKRSLVYKKTRKLIRNPIPSFLKKLFQGSPRHYQ